MKINIHSADSLSNVGPLKVRALPPSLATFTLLTRFRSEEGTVLSQLQAECDHQRRAFDISFYTTVDIQLYFRYGY